MKATFRTAAGLFGVLLLASVSNGYEWVSGAFRRPLPCAPDCYGPSYYLPGPGCQPMWYGPSYWLYPPCAPYTMLSNPAQQKGVIPAQAGMMPAQQPGAIPMMVVGKDGRVAPMYTGLPQAQRPPQQPMYPTHPFIRGPRDFFMWGEMMDEERARGSRPYPVP